MPLFGALYFDSPKFRCKVSLRRQHFAVKSLIYNTICILIRTYMLANKGRPKASEFLGSDRVSSPKIEQIRC
jgi:hypothetical protein